MYMYIYIYMYMYIYIYIPVYIYSTGSQFSEQLLCTSKSKYKGPKLESATAWTFPGIRAFRGAASIAGVQKSSSVAKSDWLSCHTTLFPVSCHKSNAWHFFKGTLMTKIKYAQKNFFRFLNHCKRLLRQWPEHALEAEKVAEWSMVTANLVDLRQTKFEFRRVVLWCT